MKIKKININSLISPQYNPRSMSDEEKEKLKNSISQWDYIDPLIVNEVNNHIVGGNQRYEVLKELGFEEVEVSLINIDNLNDEKALNIALNKISGEWDFEKLNNIFEELKLNDFNINLTGFDEKDFKSEEFTFSDTYEENDIIEDNYKIEKDISTSIKKGDLYKLGNHILYCGDATNKEDINYLIGKNNINMILTDPPYGMGLDMDFSGMATYANSEFNSRVNPPKSTNYDNRKIDEFDKNFIENIFNLGIEETFLFGANYYTEHLQNINKGSWLVWDKRSNENYSLEQSKKADKGFGSCFELIWSKKSHKQDIIRIRWFGVFGTEKEFDKKRIHPTQKPIELMAWIINKYSNKKDNILDLFGGGEQLYWLASKLIETVL